MPTAKMSPCTLPGCGALCHGGRCERHAHKRKPKNPSQPSYGMYDYRWQKTRAAFLSRHALCRECSEKGRYKLATVVDHIIPHRGDRDLFNDGSNLQALCKPCHDRKTARGE